MDALKSDLLFMGLGYSMDVEGAMEILEELKPKRQDRLHLPASRQFVQADSNLDSPFQAQVLVPLRDLVELRTEARQCKHPLFDKVDLASHGI